MGNRKGLYPKPLGIETHVHSHFTKLKTLKVGHHYCSQGKIKARIQEKEDNQLNQHQISHL